MQQSTSQPSETEELLKEIRKDLEEYKKSMADYNEKAAAIQKEFEENTTFSDVSLTESLAPVFVTQSMDSILDFINSCDDYTKEQVLEALKGSTADKALFLTSRKDNERTFVVLMNINSIPEEQGLALAYSKDLSSLSFFLSELTNLTEDEVKESFGKSED